jgi:hypothetical protein
LICGSTHKVEDALGTGLRQRILEYAKSNSSDDTRREERS